MGGWPLRKINSPQDGSGPVAREWSAVNTGQALTSINTLLPNSVLMVGAGARTTHLALVAFPQVCLVLRLSLPVLKRFDQIVTSETLIEAGLVDAEHGSAFDPNSDITPGSRNVRSWPMPLKKSAGERSGRGRRGTVGWCRGSG